MVLENATFGSLNEISQFTRALNEPTAYVFFNQILSALNQVHERGVAHLDLKENNILICHEEANSNNPEVACLPIKLKLADFGIAVDFGKNVGANNKRKKRNQKST